MPAPFDPRNAPVALVTGASSGIGEAAARMFAQRGWRVALAARRIERLEALAAEIRAAGGQALPVQADMQQFDDIRGCVDRAIAAYGRIDVLVNNAGFGRLDRLEDLDPHEDVAAQVNTNLLGLIWMAQAVLPGMLARRRGLIVNVGSIAGYVSTPTYTVYDATKFGVRGFTDALRREVGPQGIHVCGVYPAGTATEFAQVAHAGRRDSVSTPKWLELSADDVAAAIVDLTRRPRRQVIQPRVMRLAILANALFPGIVDWAVALLWRSRSG